MLDWGLDVAGRRTFLLLLGGHLLFVAGAFLMLAGEGTILSFWMLTPLFALPLVAGAGPSRWIARSAVFLLGLTAIHYLAMFLAIETVSVSPGLNTTITSSLLVTGATGGAVGAGGSLALVALTGFVARTRANLIVAGIGIASLALVGAIGMQLCMGRDAPTTLPDALWLYTPWQIAFAYVLAKLLK